MIRLKAIKTIFLWDWELEFRRSSGWFVSILFSAIVTFMTSTLIRQPSANTWLALLWMILVFTSLQLASRTFSANEGQWLYINQLVNPMELLLGKSLSTSFSTVLVSIFSFSLFYLWIGFPNIPGQEILLAPLIISLSLGSLALSFTLTFTSAIASKIDGSASLMSVLSIPLLLPALLVSLRSSKLALLGEPLHVLYPNWIGEIALCGLPLALGAVLFPYLWRS
ncbi:MAG: Uncharacterised protein [Owenweeksia sp. TMED14]|nr:MAG: Uncharacterised protein [Owenweeksia sp. TMED14]